MAQLLNTTIDGTLDVSGNITTSARVRTKSGYGLYAEDVNGDYLGIAGMSSSNNIIYGYGVYYKDDTTASSTYLYGYDNLYLFSHDGIITNSSIRIPNAYSLKSLDGDGTSRIITFLSSTNNLHLGNYESDGHTGNTFVNSYSGSVYLRNSVGSLRWYPYSTDNYDAIFNTNSDCLATCGSASYRWYRLYAASATVLTSDEREKSDIMAIADYPVTYSRNGNGNIFEQLFYKLEPKTYTLNVENTNDIHIGFIAQDVEKSMEELGLTVDDLGLINHEYWTDEETGEERDRYGLAYEEFAALNTYMIQKQQATIEEQQVQISTLEERITQLEALVINN